MYVLLGKAIAVPIRGDPLCFELSRFPYVLDQWYSTWGRDTPEGACRYLKGYAKTSYGLCKMGKLLFRDKY
jgi:hypothetical protein